MLGQLMVDALGVSKHSDHYCYLEQLSSLLSGVEKLVYLFATNTKMKVTKW